MKEDFYTFGGGHFWEDVFFYQKWRIQRNYVTKSYRLLDNWDIRRKSGTFEECRKAFVTYIDAYEIPRQKGHMIIMLHGLGQSKNIFKPLWRAALAENFMAAAVNYPSTQKDADGHVKQLNFFLNHLEDVSKISFVSYGAGNILLQKLFESKAEWQEKILIGRAVEVCPRVYASSLFEKIAKNSFLSFFTGPMIKDLMPKNLKKTPPLTAIEAGIVLSARPWYEKLLNFLTYSSEKDFSYDELKRDTHVKEVIEFETSYHNIFKSYRVRGAVMNFLKKGTF